MAVLASKDPAFVASIERRVPPARLERLATRARLECLAMIAGLVGLASVARIVLAYVCGAVLTWVAAAIALCRRRRRVMVVLPRSLPEVVCNTWTDFMGNLRNFFGPNIPFPEHSDLDVFEQDNVVTPQLAWRFMMNMASAAKYAVENSGCVYTEFALHAPRRGRRSPTC